MRAHADPTRARTVARFFKTAPGEYGAGDVFLGVSVPSVRLVATRFRALPLAQVVALLGSKFHEERLLALVILVARFQRGGVIERRAIFELYRRNLRAVNNWDLVDTSAPGIVGAYLEQRDRGWLDRLARSPRVWDRRIAIVSTQHLIRQGDFAATLRLARTLLRDRDDLIHKAAGWMLREVGNRDEATLVAFLARYADAMPRTMLRYAIERLPPSRRRAYLSERRARIRDRL